MRPSKKQRRRGPDLEEQAGLRSGFGGRRSLQSEVERVLRRSTPRYDSSWAKGVEELAREVRHVLMGASCIGGKTFDGVRERVCIARPAGKVVVPTDPPKSVSVVGSWLLRTCLEGSAALDVAIEVPGIVAKDYLNGRYFEKRGAYVAGAARVLREAGIEATLADLDGDARKPIVVARRDGSIVRVATRVDAATFASVAHKLGPKENCVRGPKGECEPATPRYNDAVLRECCADRHAKMLHGAMVEAPALGDAVVLGKAWLVRTGHAARVDGFSGFVMSMLVLHAHRTTKERRETAIELLRATLELIADWTGPVELALEGDEKEDIFGGGRGPPISAYADEVVFLDAAARVNMASRATRAALKELSSDAKVASRALRLDAPEGSFGMAFPRHPKPVWTMYDVVLRVPVFPLDFGGGKKEAWDAFPRPEALGEPLAEAVARRAAAVIARALEGRVRGVRFILESNSNLEEEVECPHVAVGARFLDDDDAVTRAALRGPEPESSSSSSSFRDFWGDKAQVRRFRDGAIVEAVVWEARDQATRRAIPERAARFALSRHLPSRCGDAARQTRPDRAALARATFQGHAATESEALCEVVDTSKPLAALEKLGAWLRETSLPVRVDAVSAASPELRGTAPFGLLERPDDDRCGLVTAIEAVVRFEASGAWAALAAENREAFRAATRALIARSASRLKQNDVRFVGVCSPGDSSVPHLRVLFSGLAFRLVPATPDRQPPTPTEPVRLDLPREPPAVRNLAFVHHALVRALAARYRALAPTTRLVARWLHAQGFSGHVSHEALEALVVAVFAAPKHANASEGVGCGDLPPAAPVAGFLRTLRLLWSRDWTTNPLFVDLRRAAADEDPPPYRRDDYPSVEVAAALPILVQYDDDDQSSSPALRFLRLDVAPELPALRLIQGAARETEAALGATLASSNVAPNERLVDEIFGRRGGAAVKRCFDARFSIRKDVVSRGALRVDDLAAATTARTNGPRACRLEKRYANLEDDKDVFSKRILLGDPVADFVDALRANYGHLALFFFNALEPSYVGIAWRPVKNKKPFHPTTSAYSQPDATDDDTNAAHFFVRPNFPEIIHDCARLGAHLVEATHYGSKPENASQPP
ncbi:hypothetical protein CTAYLR_004235 [Chrysophaeum taylorii]|uniref:U3 small nucleolar RNA-associated protein 22 n=1 Tax=Chrysophaeum taylorii TaxID=2483200 RepID=A0AAD7UDJ4_9STRA|nr:hypothetical protein CTAYLR_004235 [Chrysophaeum taylorii]